VPVARSVRGKRCKWIIRSLRGGDVTTDYTELKTVLRHSQTRLPFAQVLESERKDVWRLGLMLPNDGGLYRSG